MHVRRNDETKLVRGLLKHYPVVALIGARQVGKTSLARTLAKGSGEHFFDLESPEAVARLADPFVALKGLKKLVVLDEVQRLPNVFTVLRVLADRKPLPARFLVLGSASADLLRQSVESLAGRIAYHELGGLSLGEVGAARLDRLWLRGGFPRSFVAPSDRQSAEWRRHFVTTFLEKDIPQLGITVSGVTLRRFWTMLAHYHGQVWNASEFARSFGVSDNTVRHYLDVLASTMMVRQLLPWHENLGKRQVKSPKVFVRDSGLLHTLLGIVNRDDLLSHPKLGASWEGFLLEQLLRHLRVRSDECYFWATHAGAELDLLIVRGLKRWGFEIKRTSAPALTPSMRTALADLRLDRLDVIHAGEETFPLADKVRAVAAGRLLQDMKPLSR